MSAPDLMKRIVQQLESGGTFDWDRTREEIVAEHRSATTTADRVLCLGLYKSIMDAVERNNIGPTEMAKFQELRQQEYNLLLINEAMIEKTDGILDPVVMKVITDREVAAGRMVENDDLRKLTAAYVAVTTPKDTPKKSGGLMNSQTKAVSVAILAGLPISLLLVAASGAEGGLSPIDPYNIFNPEVIGHWVGRIGFIPLIFVVIVLIVTCRKAGFFISILNAIGAVVAISLVTGIIVVCVAAVYSVKEFPLKALGLDRDDFVKNLVSSCLRRQQTIPENKGVPQTTLNEFCTCNANSLADVTTKEDIKYQVEHGGFSPNAAAKMTSSAEKCAQAVNLPRSQ